MLMMTLPLICALPSYGGATLLSLKTTKRGLKLARFLLGCLVIGFFASSLEAQSSPSWAGDSGTTRQTYIFPTDTLIGSEDFSNAYGTPALQVTLDTTTNPGFGTGWQDPNGPFVTRASNGGAFDLGVEGSVAVTVPFAPPGGGYEMEYFVNVVFEDSFYVQPTLGISGYTISPTTQLSPNIDSDPFYDWTLANYTGTLSSVSQNSVTFFASTPGGITGPDGALVDTFEVYTRVIPEPGTYAALLGGVAAVVALYRRRTRQAR